MVLASFSLPLGHLPKFCLKCWWGPIASFHTNHPGLHLSARPAKNIQRDGVSLPLPPMPHALLIFIPTTDKYKLLTESASLLRRIKERPASNTPASVVANFSTAASGHKNASQSVGSRSFQANPLTLQFSHGGKLFTEGLPPSVASVCLEVPLLLQVKPREPLFVQGPLKFTRKGCPGKSWLSCCFPVTQPESQASSEDKPPLKRRNCKSVSFQYSHSRLFLGSFVSSFLIYCYQRPHRV